MAKFLDSNPQYLWMSAWLAYVNTRPVAKGSHEFYSALEQTPENEKIIADTVEWYRNHEPESNL